MSIPQFLIVAVACGIVAFSGWYVGTFPGGSDKPDTRTWHPCEVHEVVVQNVDPKLVAAIIIESVAPNAKTDAIGESLAACWRESR